MSNGIFSQALSKMAEAESDKQSESFAMINIRPGPKISAMLDIACHISKKTPSALIAEALSRKLAEYAVSSADHVEPVLGAAEIVLVSQGGFSPESALGLLQKKKILEICNPFMRKIAL